MILWISIVVGSIAGAFLLVFTPLVALFGGPWVKVGGYSFAALVAAFCLALFGAMSK